MIKVEYEYPSRLEGITSSQNDFEEVVEQVEKLFDNADYSSSAVVVVEICWVFVVVRLRFTFSCR